MARHSIPFVAKYRGVGIHDNQSVDRIAKVKSDIDAVFNLGEDVAALFEFAATACHAPEARLFAAALVEVIVAACKERHREVPAVNCDLLRAHVAGLNSEVCRSKTHYGSILSPRPAPGSPGLERREVPLAEGR